MKKISKHLIWAMLLSFNSYAETHESNSKDVVDVSMEESEQAISLHDAIYLTIENHPDVRSARTRIELEKQIVSSAKSVKLPTINLSSSFGKQRVRNSTTYADKDGDERKHSSRKELSLSLSQTLFDGNMGNLEIKQSKENYNIKYYEWLNTVNEFTINTSKTYFDVLEKSSNVDYLVDHYATYKKIHDQMQERVESGLASQADLFQIESRLAHVSSNLMVAKQSMAQAVSEFKSIVNVPNNNLTLPHLEKEMPFFDLEQARLRLPNHTNSKMVEHEIAVTKSGYDVVLSSFLPKVSLEINRSWSKNADGGQGQISGDDFQAMIQVSYNLYNGGSDKSELLASSYRHEERLEKKEAITRTLNKNLEVSWSSYQFLGDELPFHKTRLENARKTMEAYQEQFALGQRDLLDLLSGASELLQAQQSSIGIEFKFLMSKLELLSATGDLLEWLEIPIPSLEKM